MKTKTKLYFKLVKYIAPGKSQAFLIIAVSFLTSLFSVVSIYMILPLLNTVFDPASVQNQASESPKTPTVAVSPQKAPVGTGSDKQSVKSAADDKFEKIKEQAKVYFNQVLLGDTRERTLLNICLFLVLSFLLKNFFTYMSGQLNRRVQTKTEKRLRDEVFNKIIEMPLSYFNQKKVGALMHYVNYEVTIMHQSISGSFLDMIRQPFMILAYVTVLFTLSWKLTIFAVFTSVATLFSIRFIGKKVRKIAGKLQAGISDMNSRLQEAFTGIKLIKSTAMEAYEIKRFSEFTNQFRRIGLKIESLKGMISPLNETFGVAAIAFSLWFGGLQVFEGNMSANELIVFAFALFSIMQPVKQIVDNMMKIQVGLASAEVVFKVLDTVPDMENGAKPVSQFNQSIRLENIWFRYNKDDDAEYVLQDVSIEIKKGQTVALVGSSGSGKSTLVDLVLRFYDVDRGKIIMDGTDIRELDMKQLRRLFGVVSQEVILFNDTIGGNIAYGMSQSASPEQIIEAAKIANAHEFIQNTPEQYQTNIGDRGLRLSGGQRQRLSIARAMLKNPPVLIFDEATSALDNESEKIVQEAINNAMQDRTAIVIAHRLSTVKNADKIIVMDKGRVVETGNHFELIAKDGIYKKLYDMQFAKSQDEAGSEVQAGNAVGNS